MKQRRTADTRIQAESGNSRTRNDIETPSRVSVAAKPPAQADNEVGDEPAEFGGGHARKAAAATSSVNTSRSSVVRRSPRVAECSLRDLDTDEAGPRPG